MEGGDPQIGPRGCIDAQGKDLSAMSEEGRMVSPGGSSGGLVARHEENAGFTVIEVRDVEQSLAAAHRMGLCAERSWGMRGLGLLLDNMGAGEQMRSIALLRGWTAPAMYSRRLRWGRSRVIGRVVAEWVGLISSSALNRGIVPLDMSMLIGGGSSGGNSRQPPRRAPCWLGRA
ncbi:MAG: hypothetical protein CM1200mP32_11930 [Methanobacteriota archaeon]|nr:MAG: hypothetical protein CM1200mP32_11930 [Euryarchaeota archaeon]